MVATPDCHCTRCPHYTLLHTFDVGECRWTARLDTFYVTFDCSHTDVCCQAFSLYVYRYGGRLVGRFVAHSLLYLHLSSTPTSPHLSLRHHHGCWCVLPGVYRHSHFYLYPVTPHVAPHFLHDAPRTFILGFPLCPHCCIPTFDSYVVGGCDSLVLTFLPLYSPIWTLHIDQAGRDLN